MSLASTFNPIAVREAENCFAALIGSLIERFDQTPRRMSTRLRFSGYTGAESDFVAGANRGRPFHVGHVD